VVNITTADEPKSIPTLSLSPKELAFTADAVGKKTVRETEFTQPLQATEISLQAKPVVHTRRYQNVLAEFEEMTLAEQVFELADLNFRISVVSNVLQKTPGTSRTGRYQNAETQIGSMCQEEQELELAELKFRLVVLQAIASEQID
jgi:23S rRNA maturation mini-RNase III